MLIGSRLRALRKEMNLTQGDIQKRTGMASAYISRVEGGHTVPTLANLEKFARAFEMPLYAVLYDGNQPPALPEPLKPTTKPLWGDSGRDVRHLAKLRVCFSRIDDADRRFLMNVALLMVRRNRSR